MIKPITPTEAALSEGQHIPEFIIDAFNAMIKRKFSAGRATFTQDEIMEAIMAKSMHSRQFIFSQKWMDVEPLFRAQGWKVVFDRPAYCEEFSATYTFSSK